MGGQMVLLLLPIILVFRCHYPNMPSPALAQRPVLAGAIGANKDRNKDSTLCWPNMKVMAITGLRKTIIITIHPSASHRQSSKGLVFFRDYYENNTLGYTSPYGPDAEGTVFILW